MVEGEVVGEGAALDRHRVRSYLLHDDPSSE